MEQTNFIKNILDKWAQYTQFDENRTKFSLKSYQIHRIGKNIQQIMPYDPSGAIAVLYIKQTFTNIIDNSTINIATLLKNPNVLHEEQELYDLLQDPMMQALETTLIARIDKFTADILKTPLIGSIEKDKIKQMLHNSIAAIVDELDRCNIDVYTPAPAAMPVTHFSSVIKAFNTTSECVLTLECQPDGMYVCYIRNNDTTDGYFGFFIKSAGTVVSINDRVDETFPGQHAVSRNNRWIKEKRVQIFPYDNTVNVNAWDYKGYATQTQIKNNEIDMLTLPTDSLLTLLFAMAAIANRYVYDGFDLQARPVKFIDTLIDPQRREKTMSTALTVATDSAILAHADTFRINITEQNITDQTFVNSISDKSDSVRCNFPKEQPVFALLYKDGFKLNKNTLFETKKAIGNTFTPEFITTNNTFDLIAYQRAREQLAHHIRKEMINELNRIGGMQSIRNWYQNALRANKDHIFDMCAKFDKNAPFYDDISCVVTTHPFPFYLHGFEITLAPFNEVNQRGDGKLGYVCPVTGQYASIFFVFSPSDDTAIKHILNCDTLPKLIQGYKASRTCHGNPLLDIIDPVTNIGTIFESHEIKHNRLLWTKRQYKIHNETCWSHDIIAEIPDDKDLIQEETEYRFTFLVGFSKRGIASIKNKLKKQKKKNEG